MKILITGSRAASGRLLMIAQQFVMSRKNDEFIVGDADGVDNIVILSCDAQETLVTVFGGYKKMRHSTRFGKNVPLNMDYLGRDRYMVEQHPDLCVAFWDGQSRGTMYTAKYAKSHGIETIIVK